MNTTLLLPLTASSRSGPTSPVPLSDVPEVRLALRLVDRQAKKSQTRPQPLARALLQVVEKHRAVWSTPVASPAVSAPAPTTAPTRPFHLVVPALEATPSNNDDRRAGHPILRVGSLRRETK
jgi:hypothetical protein